MSRSKLTICDCCRRRAIAAQGNVVVNLGDALGNFPLLGHAVFFQLHQVVLEFGLNEPALLGGLAVGVEHLADFGLGGSGQLGGAACKLIYNQGVFLRFSISSSSSASLSALLAALGLHVEGQLVHDKQALLGNLRSGCPWRWPFSFSAAVMSC